MYCDLLQSYQGKATHRYADFSGVVLGRCSVTLGIHRYTDFSGVVLGLLQSCQGRATHRYADFSGVVLGCCAVILGIHRYADFRCFTVVFFSHTHKTRIVVENEIHQKVSFSGVA